MSMLVEQQGKVLEQTEEHAETTVGHLEQGNTMIAKAIRSARATRHVRLTQSSLRRHVNSSSLHQQ